jgi:Pentapeptide repeats (9 copies)
VSPEVAAAIIAASVSLLTLFGSLSVQVYGLRRNARETDEIISRQLGQQWDQLEITLAAQQDRLESTLADQRSRALNTRFATAADRLGADKPPMVRLAGIYAMAGLADDWPQKDGKQTCVDVLCGYLRMPYDREPAADAPAERIFAFQADQQLRHTLIRVIAAHLRDGAPASWQGLNLDFTGVRFDGGDFDGTRFSGGTVTFDDAVFTSGTVSFARAQFTGGAVSFRRAVFAGGTVGFEFADFSGTWVNFRRAVFSAGTVDFGCARFADGQIWFDMAEFCGSRMDFAAAKFSGGLVSFAGAKVSGAPIDFSHVVDWSHPPAFDVAGSAQPGIVLPAPPAAPMRAARRPRPRRLPNATMPGDDQGPGAAASQPGPDSRG